MLKSSCFIIYWQNQYLHEAVALCDTLCPAAEARSISAELMSVPKFLLYVNEDMLRLHLNILELILMNIRQVEQLRKLQNP